MPSYRDIAEFGPTIDAVAERLSISAAAVEKDYWVSEILRRLAYDYRANFVFKGGTSLSKCYSIVERFSEDIDVLVLCGDRAKGQVDRLMKDMAVSTGGSNFAEHLGEHFGWRSVAKYTPRANVK